MSDSVQVAIGILDGKVIAKWHAPVSEIAFDPKNAYAIGIALSRAAMEAHQGKATGKESEFIAGELAQVKVKVTDAQRMALVMTVSTIVRTLMDQKRSAGYISQHAVDAVLQETAR